MSQVINFFLKPLLFAIAIFIFISTSSALALGTEQVQVNDPNSKPSSGRFDGSSTLKLADAAKVKVIVTDNKGHFIQGANVAINGENKTTNREGSVTYEKITVGSQVVDVKYNNRVQHFQTGIKSQTDNNPQEITVKVEKDNSGIKFAAAVLALALVGAILLAIRIWKKGLR